MSPPDMKKQRTGESGLTESRSMAADVRSRRSAFLASLKRDVSPPAGRESLSSREKTGLEMGLTGIPREESSKPSSFAERPRRKITESANHRIVSSSFKLTRIRDLPTPANVDTIGIKDILGDVMLKEVWLFDFLYDVDWVIQQFDPDVQHLVSIVLVHGSWRREDSNKIHIDEASKRYPNVRVVTAHMPEMYGCHHSKSMVLFRHDDLAQVIIHTANMIEQDWRNMTQAVWLSPLLPFQKSHAPKETAGSLPVIGTGARFKQDFMDYLRYYGNRTSNLVSLLERYDFTSIRAALIAHVPTKFDGKEIEPTAHLWGWPALKRALGSIPGHDNTAANSTKQKTPHIVCQVSSIASLSDKWFRETLFPALSTTSTTPAIPSSKKARPTPPSHPKPKFSIIFPTPSEIRTSLDGYAAGGSIHCKLQTAAQRKQFSFMKPHLCHWKPPSPPSATTTTVTFKTPNSSNPGIVGKALRGPAAPHIKTFVRFDDTKTRNSIDWALLTSANLSTQAWGSEANAQSGDVRISSYELGVLVWPDLFLEDGAEDEQGESGIGDEGKENGEERGQNKKRGSNRRKGRPTAIMVPTFASDKPTPTQIENAINRTTSGPQHSKTAAPDPEEIDTESETESEGETEPEPETATAATDVTVVALRMPYDLPLMPYGPADEVWSARASYAELDRFGRAWNVDG